MMGLHGTQDAPCTYKSKEVSCTASRKRHQDPRTERVAKSRLPPPLAQARPRSQKGALRWGWRGAANGEEHLIKSGIMLNLLPIPHVLQMDVVVPMTRGTKNIGRHMFPSALSVRDSHAGNNIVSHG